MLISYHCISTGPPLFSLCFLGLCISRAQTRSHECSQHIRTLTEVSILTHLFYPQDAEGARDCWTVAFGNSFSAEERCVAAGYDNGDVKVLLPIPQSHALSPIPVVTGPLTHSLLSCLTYER